MDFSLVLHATSRYPLTLRNMHRKISYTGGADQLTYRSEKLKSHRSTENKKKLSSFVLLQSQRFARLQLRRPHTGHFI